MSTAKKDKKHHPKKESLHEIPTVKTAKGRRPHTEELAEPYQPSLLSEEELQPQVEAQAHVESEQDESMAFNEGASVEAADVVNESLASEETAVGSEPHTEAVVLEGKPAPEPESKNKIDISGKLENVLGMMQMGTAIVKSSFPKSYEIAEKVVEEWKHDGDFSELPINQPLVQFYVGLGLRKAKQTEKEIENKLESTGVLPVVRQQLHKAQKLFK